MITLPTVKKIGIKMSGGADSSLVAYLIVNYIIKNKLDIKVYPMVIIEEESPFQHDFVSRVTDFIEKKTGFKFQDKIIKYHYANTDKIKTIRLIEEESRDKLDLVVSGITHWPKDKSFNEPDGPEGERSGVFPTMWDDWIYTPFVNLDKKEIAEIYREHNLLDTLFPLTRSCVKKTNDFTTHCGECWWCKERVWGFGTV